MIREHGRKRQSAVYGECLSAARRGRSGGGGGSGGRLDLGPRLHGRHPNPKSPPARLQGIRACEGLVRPLHRPALVDGLAAWSDKSTDNRTSQQELHVSPEATRPVPAVAAVKQLASTWTQKGDDVLKIRRRAGGCSQSRRIERAALPGEEDEAEEAASDLEAARTDVLVWQTIAREVEDRP